MKKDVYFFGIDGAEGNASQKDLLGGKGANLAEMANLGLPIPPGFTIPTHVCNDYLKAPFKEAFIEALVETSILPGIKKLISHYGYLPLVSVRSGARVSAPGMMDTILNIGLKSTNLHEWSERIGEKTTWDNRRRLIQMYGETVKGIPYDVFAIEYAKIAKFKYGLSEAPQKAGDFTAYHFKKMAVVYETIYMKYTNDPFPDTLQEQLCGAIAAVFESWNSERAIQYREMHGYSHDWGTAVNIQTMVFGNMNDDSASGVLFSRDPSTGDNHSVGEYLVNAQGEDVVSGSVTPLPLKDLKKWNKKVYNDLLASTCLLESHYKDMQDIEFTIQYGKLYILQTRNGKRSAEAAFRIAYEMYAEDWITKEEAISRVSVDQYKAMNRDVIDPEWDTPPNCKGIPASAGIVSGVVVFTSQDAIDCKEPCILVTKETTPNDLKGMVASEGVLTQTGGATSHAAVVARGLDKPCVVGCIDVYEHLLPKGQKITIDGSTGNVWVDIDVPVKKAGSNEWVDKLLSLYEFDQGTYFRITPKIHNMPPQPYLYIDTYAYDNYTEELGKILSSIDYVNTKELILDLRSEEDYYQPEDTILLEAFGPLDKSKATLHPKANLLLEDKELQFLKDKCHLVLPEKGTEELSKALRDAGWKIAGNITTLDSLIEMNGLGDIDPKLFDNYGHQLIHKILNMKEQLGHKIKTMPDVVYSDVLPYIVLTN